MAVFLTVSRDGWTKGFQLSVDDDNGGYRIAGPKFNGSSEVVMRHALSERDARELRLYLDRAFPAEAA